MACVWREFVVSIMLYIFFRASTIFDSFFIPPPASARRQAFKKSPCARLKVLWLQRLDLWDDLESLALALGPAHCPVLEELFLDLALDTDDIVRLAACLHK